MVCLRVVPLDMAELKHVAQLPDKACTICTKCLVFEDLESEVVWNNFKSIGHFRKREINDIKEKFRNYVSHTRTNIFINNLVTGCRRHGISGKVYAPTNKILGLLMKQVAQIKFI